MYENIDMKKTGILLKETIEKAGYTVKDIQKILHLSCPQPIYRWFKGDYFTIGRPSLCIEPIAEDTYGRFTCSNSGGD